MNTHVALEAAAALVTLAGLVSVMHATGRHRHTGVALIAFGLIVLCIASHT